MVYESGTLKSIFIGQVEHRIDSKGRVSMPAVYRSVIHGETSYLKDSLGFIEIVPLNVYLQDTISKRERFMAHKLTLFPKIDPDGRIVLNAELRIFLETPKNEGKVTFFGLGKTFGICSSHKWPYIANGFDNSLKHADLAP